MSNFALLAQTTLPSTLPTTQLVRHSPTLEVAFLTLIIIWLPVVLTLIVRRRLASIGPVPQLPETANAGVVAGVLLTAVAMYFAVSAAVATLLGLTQENLSKPEAIRQAVFWQPAGQIAATLVILGMLTAVGGMPGALQWRKPAWRDLARGLGVWALAFPVVLIVGAVVEQIARRFSPSPDQHIIFKLWTGEPGGPTLFKTVAFISAAILAPIEEELVFRGLLQRLIQQLLGRPWLAILFTSLAFAAVHSPHTIQPPIFVLSLFLGAAYFRTGSILVPIAMHAVFNTLEFALFVLVPGSS